MPSRCFTFNGKFVTWWISQRPAWFICGCVCEGNLSPPPPDHCLTISLTYFLAVQKNLGMFSSEKNLGVPRKTQDKFRAKSKEFWCVCMWHIFPVIQAVNKALILSKVLNFYDDIYRYLWSCQPYLPYFLLPLIPSSIRLLISLQSLFAFLPYINNYSFIQSQNIG